MKYLTGSSAALPYLLSSSLAPAALAALPPMSRPATAAGPTTRRKAHLLGAVSTSLTIAASTPP